MELGLTLLAQASLLFSDWDHAFLTSVYLINRLPSSSIKFEILYEKLFKLKPDYQFLSFWLCMFSSSKAIQQKQTPIQVSRMSFSRLFSYVQRL